MIDYATSYVRANGVPNFSTIKDGVKFGRKYGILPQYLGPAEVVVDAIDAGIDFFDQGKQKVTAASEWVVDHPKTSGAVILGTAVLGTLGAVYLNA